MLVFSLVVVELTVRREIVLVRCGFGFALVQRGPSTMDLKMQSRLQRITRVIFFCRFEVIRRLVQVAFGFVQKRQLHVRVWNQETVLLDFLLHRHDGLETLFCVQRAVHNAQTNSFQQTPECLVVVLVFTSVLPRIFFKVLCVFVNESVQIVAQ